MSRGGLKGCVKRNCCENHHVDSGYYVDPSADEYSIDIGNGLSRRASKIKPNSQTMMDFIALAKNRPGPSEYNSPGPSDNIRAGVITHPPAKNSPPGVIKHPIVLDRPELGRRDYVNACGDVYATFMNEQTMEDEEAFEEFMKNKISGGINRAVAASYNGLISDEELEAYKQGYRPDVQSSEDKVPDDVLPVVYMMPRMIGGVADPTILRTLLDSGSSKSLISKLALPEGAEIRPCEQEAMNTMAGMFQPMGYVILKDLRLPEFNKNLSIDGQMAYVFDTPCRYQVIAGRDFLRRTGIDLTFKENHITWMDNSIPMKSPNFSEASYNAVIDEYNYWLDEDAMNLEESYISQMMPAKYEKADLDEFAKE